MSGCIGWSRLGPPVFDADRLIKSHNDWVDRLIADGKKPGDLLESMWFPLMPYQLTKFDFDYWPILPTEPRS